MRFLHVWLLPIVDELPTSLLDYITDEEKKHAGTMLSVRRKKEWLSARALLRACLAHYTGSDPLVLLFDKTEEGKPTLIHPVAQLAFNLSHGPRWIACAVSKADAVGIDVDCETRRNRIDDIAENYFHPREQETLRAIADSRLRSREFFRCWTMKEAFIKAQGKTITGARLRKIAFAKMPTGGQEALFALPAGNWHFLHKQFDGDHHLALASHYAKCDTDDSRAIVQYSFWQWHPETGDRHLFAMNE